MVAPFLQKNSCYNVIVGDAAHCDYIRLPEVEDDNDGNSNIKYFIVNNLENFNIKPQKRIK